MEYDVLLEEEVEILEIFSHAMNSRGHNGYYSFYDNISNGYYIYKDNDKWVVCFNKKGKTINVKQYTNIYNLCSDILKELKIDDFCFSRKDFRIPRGTRVIISKSDDCPIDEIKKGIIIDSKVAKVGSAQPERVYQVLGDDNKMYTGLYGLKLYSDINFRTMEDYIKDTKDQIEYNNETIQELHDLNWEMYLALNEVTRDYEKYLEDEGNIKTK